MSKISRKSKPEKFTVIDNQIFGDTRMSLKATGMLCMLLSFPPDWQVYVHDLKNRKKDGRDSVQSAINELISLGYINRLQVRKSGQFKGYDYEVSDSPKPGKPDTVKPETEKPETGNPELLKTKGNKGLNNTKNLKEEKDLTNLKVLFKKKAEKILKDEKINLPEDQLLAFVDYWTEPDRKTGKKFRCELEKTWDMVGRIRTWERNWRTKFGVTEEVQGNQKLDYEIG